MDAYTFLKKDLMFVDEAITFFLSAGIDDDLHNEIIDTVRKKKGTRHQPWLDFGMLSEIDFIFWYDNKSSIEHLKLILKLLTEKFMIFKSDFTEDPVVYYVNKPLVQYFHKMNLIKNVLFGPGYSVHHFNDSVFKIEHWSQNDAPSIGTGFFFGVQNQSGRQTSFIITNKHVVENARTIDVIDHLGNKLEYVEIIAAESEDLAAIILTNTLTINPFNFNFEPDYLDEIFTMGFPSVPMTREAYLLTHKGEINSFVKDYLGNDYMLISAKTSGGNSGGPIIDITGRVVGIVTSEFYDEEQMRTKGKLPYYAGIPSINILNFLNEKVVPRHAL